MKYVPFDLRLSSDLLRSSGDHLVFEIRSSGDLRNFLELDVGDAFKDAVRKSFAKKKPFHLRSYCRVGKCDEVSAFSCGDETRFFEEAWKVLGSIKGDVVFRCSEGSDFIKRADALALSSYSFTEYKTDGESRERRLILVRQDRTNSNQKALFSERVRLLSCIRMARDLVNVPPSDKSPKKLAEFVRSLPWERTEVETIDKAAMERLSFWCLLWVSRGSDEEPVTLVFRRKKSVGRTKMAIVGKGVTFDAGGLQIKGDESMTEMKSDMAGAAAVIAAMFYLDAFDDLVEDVVGAVGLTENLVWGSAMKPLDILTSRNGKTVEVHHTDAEWRLVLADVVAHVVDTDVPDSVVTVATLTGACIFALGFDYAGMIGDDRKTIRRIRGVSESDGFEKFWELPLDARMIEATKGDVSDYRNISKGMKAWASMGAAFISNFRWKAGYVHLDIAGPAFRPSAWGVFPKDATGFWVATLSGLFRKTR